MPKTPYIPPTPPGSGGTLGLSPDVLAKRGTYKPQIWCPKEDPLMVDFDPYCNPYKPKAITFKDVAKAHHFLKDKIPVTPLLKSKCCSELDMNLYLKVETVHKTGSFHERGAIYALHTLTPEQCQGGVYAASLGNWAMALAYEGRQLGIRVTVVLPFHTHVNITAKCKAYGAYVELYGKDLAEARTRALDMIKISGRGTYINGSDHPYAIAAAGSIGYEILEQLPNVDAVVIPIGGGGLIAGIATVIKQLKPDTLIYGVEAETSHCFSSAIENEGPCQTEVSPPLAVPIAGYNAFYTARSLIDKIVSIRNDWILRSILNLVEEERLVAHADGVVAFATIVSEPNIVPELRDKNVVCLITGANIDNITFPRALERAKALEGRLVSMKVNVATENNMQEFIKMLKVITNLGCNILRYDMEKGWLESEVVNLFTVILSLETRGLQHACTLKHVMEKLFPNKCVFQEETFSPKTRCPCFPKLWPNL